MLDMGFLPDIRRVLKHLPPRRQTLFFSATMPPPIQQLTREMLKNPFTVNLERKAAPAVGITQAVYPVSAEPEGAAPGRAPEAGRHQERPRVHPHEAPGQPPGRGSGEEGRFLRAHPRQPHPGAADAGPGRLQERQVPRARRHRHRRARHRRRGAVARRQLRRAQRPRRLHPPGRAHRPGRDDRRRLHVRLAGGGRPTSRAIEREIGKRLPRITVPGFDYAKAPAERFEVPIAERIAAIRARKAEERKRAKEKAERRLAHESAQRSRGPQRAERSGGIPRGPAGGARPAGAAPATAGHARWGRRG